MDITGHVKEFDIQAITDIEKLEKVSFILKTIAHPLRIGIIGLLVDHGKMCVGDICSALSSEQSLTSHHLSNMKLAGILGSERDGKNINYYLKMTEVVDVIKCMNKCEVL
jgi:DNA-binding transcriptional ArsR family regulator